MIKLLLKIAKIIIRITLGVLLVGTLVGLVIGLISLRLDMINTVDSLESEITFLKHNYNQLISNETQLLGQIQANKIEQPDLIKLLNSDVSVSTFFGEGAGTIIKKTENRMYILTCYHVIAEIDKINKAGMKVGVTIAYSKKDERNSIAGTIAYGAQIVKTDEEHDLALLKIFVVDNNLMVVNLAAQEPQKGDTVYSIGSPLGIWRTISKGIISNKQDGYYISDNTTTYGNSGGGLYNSKGELIGVPSNVMGYSVAKKKPEPIPEPKFVPESSLGLSIDLPTIKDFLEGTDY
jgi:S1-C subfamily serine protease